MTMLRFLDAGESHGQALTVIIEGLPANLPINPEDINHQLQRRQSGYGRGGRMEIEKDQVEILSGLRHGLTLGTPISLLIKNRDWENWKTMMAPLPVDQTIEKVTRPRPGHADLAGALKYSSYDVRNILERASARETATRVAAGAVAFSLLKEFSIDILSYTKSLGPITAPAVQLSFTQKRILRDTSLVACLHKETSKAMIQEIKKAKGSGDSLGGIISLETTPLPIGLGSHVHWDRKLDGLLSQALMSIQAIKGVEFGLGFLGCSRPGSTFHDEIFYDKGKGFYHKSNHAGGLEGGITNGEPLLIQVAMKPIPTLYQPLSSVDLLTKEPFQATVERSDVCALPACGVVVENVVAFTLAQALLEKFSGDNLMDIIDSFHQYQKRLGETFYD